MNVTLPRQLRFPTPPPTRAELIRSQIVWPFIMVGFLVIMGVNGMLRWEHGIIAGAAIHGERNQRSEVPCRGKRIIPAIGVEHEAFARADVQEGRPGTGRETRRYAEGLFPARR